MNASEVLKVPGISCDNNQGFDCSDCGNLPVSERRCDSDTLKPRAFSSMPQGSSFCIIEYRKGRQDDIGKESAERTFALALWKSENPIREFVQGDGRNNTVAALLFQSANHAFVRPAFSGFGENIRV